MRFSVFNAMAFGDTVDLPLTSSSKLINQSFLINQSHPYRSGAVGSPPAVPITAARAADANIAAK